MRRFAILLTALCAAVSAGQSCFAQAQGLFNQGGTTQQQAGGAQGLGQGGLQGGVGQGGGGNQGLGQGADSGPQISDIGSLGDQVGQNQFVGQGNQGQFIGNRQVGTQQGQGTQARFQQAGGGQGFRQPDNDQQGSERRIRPRYRIAFDYNIAGTATIAERSRQQLQTFRTAFNLPDTISVEFDDAGTVILRGEAQSAEMSRLITNVVRLEPGVRNVKNELVVAEDGEPE